MSPAVRIAAALAFVSAVWGASFLFIKVMVEDGIEPLGVSASRTTLAMVALAPIVVGLRAQIPRTRTVWLRIAALSLFNFAIPWTLIAFAQQYTTSATASVANAMLPLWVTAFAAWLIPGERIGRSALAGIAAGFLGVFLLLAPDLRDVNADVLRGVPVLLLATAFYGISAIGVRRGLAGVHPVMVTFGRVSGATALLLPASLATSSYADVDWSPGTVASVVLLGVLGSGIAVVFYMWLIAHAGPVRASVVTYIIPFIGVFLGWLVLDESIGWNMFAGLALVIAGVALVQGYAGRLIRRPAAIPVPAASGISDG